MRLIRRLYCFIKYLILIYFTLRNFLYPNIEQECDHKKNHYYITDTFPETFCYQSAEHLVDGKRNHFSVISYYSS